LAVPVRDDVGELRLVAGQPVHRVSYTRPGIAIGITAACAGIATRAAASIRLDLNLPDVGCLLDRMERARRATRAMSKSCREPQKGILPFIRPFR
jgi:hypothetical protein